MEHDVMLETYLLLACVTTTKEESIQLALKHLAQKLNTVTASNRLILPLFRPKALLATSELCW